MPFRLTRRFRKKYDRLFRKDPMMANVFLLLCELADEKGRVITNEEELAKLMGVRFDDPAEYAL